MKYQAFHGAPIPLAEGLAYSVQPATSPTADGWNTANNGTEYFMSALDFDATTDNRIALWAMTNTKSLDDPTPTVTLTAPTIVSSETYGQPPNAEQKKGPIPLGDALGEHEEQVATNDDRMNQVVYADGKLWSAVNTVVRTSNGASSSTDRSGIAYFVVSPSTPTATSVAGSIANQGYVALGNNDNAFFPSIGVNAAGKGVMTFSVSGHHYFPSAAYTPIDAVNGAGADPHRGGGRQADRRRVGLRGVRRRRSRSLGRLLGRCRRRRRVDLDRHGVHPGRIRLPAVHQRLGDVRRRRNAVTRLAGRAATRPAPPIARTAVPAAIDATGSVATSVTHPTSPTTFSARGQRRCAASCVNADAFATA